MLAQLLAQIVVGQAPVAQRHKRNEGLALQIVRASDHGGLRHVRVADEGALDLGGAEAVSRHI